MRVNLDIAHKITIKFQGDEETFYVNSEEVNEWQLSDFSQLTNNI